MDLRPVAGRPTRQEALGVSGSDQVYRDAPSIRRENRHLAFPENARGNSAVDEEDRRTGTAFEIGDTRSEYVDRAPLGNRGGLGASIPEAVEDRTRMAWRHEAQLLSVGGLDRPDPLSRAVLVRILGSRAAHVGVGGCHGR